MNPRSKSVRKALQALEARLKEARKLLEQYPDLAAADDENEECL